MFVEKLHAQMETMQQCLAAGEFDRLRELAYWLKGTGGSVGFEEFTRPAAQLESFAREGDSEGASRMMLVLKDLTDRLVFPDTQITKKSNSDPDSPTAGNKHRAPSPVPNQPLVSGPVVSRLAGQKKFHHLIVKFGEKLTQQMQVMETAWEQRDMQELETFAGWLKGAAGTLGFDDLTEPAAKLQTYAASAMTEQIEQSVAHIRALTGALIVPTLAEGISAQQPGDLGRDSLEIEGETVTVETDVEGLAFHSDQEFPAQTVPGGNDEAPVDFQSEGETAHNQTDDYDTAILGEEEPELEEELKQSAASLGDDSDSFMFPKEEIVDQDARYSHHKEKLYSPELETDNT
jgi:HPt (histidine-containing phosphotransfer) domain-containing protein